MFEEEKMLFYIDVHYLQQQLVMHLKDQVNILHLSMQCGQYEKLVNDSTLLQPDEYIFLYTNNDSIMQRNKTRGKELSKAWIDRSRT